MESNQVVVIGRQLILTGILLTLPTVAVSLIVGLVMSIFQTLTSIQEQTLSFAPRIFSVGVALMITMPWMLHVLVNFSLWMFWLMTEATL